VEKTGDLERRHGAEDPCLVGLRIDTEKGGGPRSVLDWKMDELKSTAI
jgi:hypothetical protein